MGEGHTDRHRPVQNVFTLTLELEITKQRKDSNILSIAVHAVLDKFET